MGRVMVTLWIAAICLGVAPAEAAPAKVKARPAAHAAKRPVPPSRPRFLNIDYRPTSG